MAKLNGSITDVAYLLMRIVVGLLFAQHGAQKLFGALGGHTVHLMSQAGASGIIEFFGGLLVAFGIFTTWAAVITSGEMAVAYFQVHWPQAFWPIVNKGEAAVIYCFVFLFIASRGGGRWKLVGR